MCLGFAYDRDGARFNVIAKNTSFLLYFFSDIASVCYLSMCVFILRTNCTWLLVFCVAACRVCWPFEMKWHISNMRYAFCRSVTLSLSLSFSEFHNILCVDQCEWKCLLFHDTKTTVIVSCKSIWKISKSHLHGTINKKNSFRCIVISWNGKMNLCVYTFIYAEVEWVWISYLASTGKFRNEK